MDRSYSSSEFTVTDETGMTKEFSSFHELSSEGFCRVVKAKRHGRWHVLKCLKEEYAEQSMYRLLLRKEFEIGTRLNHKNIAGILGWEDVEGYGDCIIQEYIEGVSLKVFLESKPSRSIRRKLAGELLEVVSYMNGLQVVHRDLKPANIMISSNGNNLKIIDFGLSDTDDYAVLKEPAGSEKYMSPEQQSGNVPDCRNDIYSVGVILKILDAGRDYNSLARKCCLDINRRYRCMEEASAQIKRRMHVKWASVTLMLVLTLAGLTSYAIRTLKENKHEQMITEKINRGKEISDSLTNKMLAFFDSMTKDFSGAENGFEKYVEQTQDYMDEMERSHGCFNEAVAALTAECSEGDKSVIIQGIKERHESNCIKLVENMPNIEMPVPK